VHNSKVALLLIGINIALSLFYLAYGIDTVPSIAVLISSVTVDFYIGIYLIVKTLEQNNK